MNEKTQLSGPKVSTVFLERWILVNVIGWTIIFVIISQIRYNPVRFTSDFIIGHVAGILLIAILQGITLSGYLRSPYKWSLLTFISLALLVPVSYSFINMGISYSIYGITGTGFILMGPINGAVIGFVLALPQWILLSWQGFKRAFWITRNVLTFGVVFSILYFFTMRFMIPGLILSGPFLGFIYGFVTGATLNNMFEKAKTTCPSAPLTGKCFALRVGAVIVVVLTALLVREGLKVSAPLDKLLNVSGCKSEINAHYSFMNCAAVSSDGSLVAMAGNPTHRSLGTLDIRYVQKGKSKIAFKKSCTFRDIAFSPDNRLLAGWVQDVGKSQLIFFSIDDFSILHRVQYQKEDLWGRPGLDFSPDGTVLAAGSAANVKLWRVSDYSLLSEIQGSGFVKFSPNGQLIASKPANNYKIVSLWQVKDGKEVFSLKGHRDAYDAVFSPDSTLLATVGGHDKTTKLWRVADGVLLNSFKSTKYSAHCVAFSGDGTLLAIGGYQGMILIRDVNSGQLKDSIKAYKKPVAAVGFFNGTPLSLWSASQRGLFRVWEL